MKSRIFALAVAVAALAASGSVAAQSYTFGWNPRSGDVWVDTRLDDVNRYGSRYREPFVNEMTRYYGAPRDLVVGLLGRNWAPGDIYYACAIAQVIGRPCRHVVDEWERDHGQGWGNIAKRLGIKPGSAEFHRLKRGFVPTYDRWARPITLDQDLYRDFPNRARSNHAGNDPRGHGNSGHGNASGNDHERGKAGAHGNNGNNGNGNGNKGHDKGHDKGNKGNGKSGGKG